MRARQPELAIAQAEIALRQDPYDVVALYQELLAKRGSGDTSQIETLTAKIKEARKQTEQKQVVVDKYRLQ